MVYYAFWKMLFLPNFESQNGAILKIFFIKSNHVFKTNIRVSKIAITGRKNGKPKTQMAIIFHALQHS